MGALGELIGRLFRRRAAGQVASTDPRVLQAEQLVQSGQSDKAEQIGKRILAVEPRNAEAHRLLGRIALERGRSDLAIRHYSAAIAVAPEQADLRQGLGRAFFAAGRLPDAMRCLEEAIGLDPWDAVAHENLGNCHRHLGQLAEAAACYRKAVLASPKDASAYVSLADVLTELGESAAAVRIARQGLRAGEDVPEAHYSLARALYRAGDFEESLRTLQAIAAGESRNPLLYHGFGAALSELGRSDEAIANFREAIAKKPDFALAHNSLGAELLSRNDLDGAIASFRKALALKADFAARVHSNLLMTMNYQAGATQKQIYEESLRFDQRQARKLLRPSHPFDNARDRAKVLKLGYVSPDFREHSVAFFTRKLIGAHDRQRVEVYCYADVRKPDAVTRVFQAGADHWLPITGMTDEDVAARIRADGIDVLVDLAGHTSDNRLLVFAQKPAPVQVTWLGYPNTTGMRAIDYRVTDALADPPGDADRLHTEKLVRLEHGFLCYQPDDRSPDVSPAPCLKNGHVTFGTFNTTRKVTPDVVATWAQILQAVPGARLLLKSATLDAAATRDGFLRMFAQHGIAGDRLELLGFVTDERKHLQLYSGVDIGLDPFPYNGTTTTCDALWMGVPVIVLAGDRHAGRVGASIMNQVGLAELVARDKEEYVALARGLAGDRERLVKLRASLRPRLRQSPLMNVELFTATLEAAYRDMWIKWCDGRRQ